jgi:hypothetical protein
MLYTLAERRDGLRCHVDDSAKGVGSHDGGEKVDMMTQLSIEETLRKQMVLKGPPGLLFGLTLLVLIAAIICLGWGPDPVGDETIGPADNAAVARPTTDADAPGRYQPLLSVPPRPHSAVSSDSTPEQQQQNL